MVRLNRMRHTTPDLKEAKFYIKTNNGVEEEKNKD